VWRVGTTTTLIELRAEALTLERTKIILGV
jgi:hypothetical protein